MTPHRKVPHQGEPDDESHEPPTLSGDELPTSQTGEPSSKADKMDDSSDSMFELSKIVGPSNIAADESEKPKESAIGIPARTVGDFELLQPIGQGGMGTIFKARDRRLGRIAAVKILAQHVAAPKDLKRFHSEARAAGALNHSNIVPVYDVGEADGCHFIVMNYVEGESLAELLARNNAPLPPEVAARYAEEIGHAVVHVHENDIVHRDLKPGNVLIDTKDNIRVTDFGLARELQSNDDLTRTGQVMGTPGFMSPEAAKGESREVGPAADIYGMGAVLYCLLANRPPFQAATPYETIRQVISSDPVALRQLDPSIPRDLETICMKALEKEPTRRYPTAQEMVDDLRRFQDGDPIKARPVSAFTAGIRWIGRHKAATSLVALAAMLCIASMLAFVLWHEYGVAQRVVADARRHAELAEQLAQTESYFSLTNEARRFIAEGAPGWSWRALDKLEKAAEIQTDARDELELRNAAAECLGALDFRPITTLSSDIICSDVAVSPDGRWLAISELKRQDAMRLRIYDTATWELHRKIDVPVFRETLSRLFQGVTRFQEGIRLIAFSPNSRWLVAGTRHGHLIAVDLDNAEAPPVKWQGHPSDVMQLEFSADGKTLYTLDESPPLKRWSVEENWQPDDDGPDLPGNTSVLAIDPTGAHIAMSGGRIFDATSGMQLPGPDAAINTVCFSPDGRFLLGKLEYEQSFLLYEIATNQSRSFLTDPHLDVSTRRQPFVFEASSTWFLSTGYEERIALYEFTSREKIGEIATPGRDDPSVAADPQGRFMAVAMAKGVEIYEVRGSEVMASLENLCDPVQAIDLSSEKHRCIAVAESNADAQFATVASYELPERAVSQKRHVTAPLGHHFRQPRSPRSVAIDEQGTVATLSGAAVPPIIWQIGNDALGLHRPGEQAFISVSASELAASAVENDTVELADDGLQFRPRKADERLRLALPRAVSRDGHYLYLNLKAHAAGDDTAVWKVALANEKGESLSLPDLAAQSLSKDNDQLVPIGFVPPGYDHVEITTPDEARGISVRELLLVPVRDHHRGRVELEDAGPYCIDDCGQIWGVLDEDQLVAWRWPDREIIFHWNNRPALQLQGVSRINALASGGGWTIAGTRAGQLAVISHQTMKVERIVDGPGGPVTACAVDKHGHCIVGTQEGKVRIIDPQDGRQIADLAPFRREIASVDVSQDGKWLVIAGEDIGWRLMQHDGSEYTTWLEQTSQCASARISGDGGMLVVLNHGEHAPRMWRLDQLREVWASWNLR